MKTLKSILLGVALLVTSVAANAAKPAPGKPEGAKLSKSYAVNAYIDAVAKGKSADLMDAMDQSIKFSSLRGTKIMCFDKADVLKFFKENQNVTQNCAVSSKVVSENDDVTVVKVDMKYDHFVRSNYVTLTNTGNGWKITNVHSVFK